MSSSGQSMREDPHKPKLAIIGGSGLCSFPELQVISTVRPETKYGPISDEIKICRYEGEMVAFLPRHGRDHSIAPHKVPYKANLEALRLIGVKYVIATCIVGSLQKDISPGSFVIPDQFVNLTWGRDDYISQDQGRFVHLPMADPYCENLRRFLTVSATRETDKVKDRGTVAVIQGPRFSTRAESTWLSKNGWDIVNMTQYPECYFARELGLCYGAIASVTDYDVGLREKLEMNPSNMDQILSVFRSNIVKTKRIVQAVVAGFGETTCGCARRDVRLYYEKS